MTVFHLVSLFGRAFLKSATVQNAANGLRKTGIYPLNRQYHEFAPMELANTAHQGHVAPVGTEADVQRHDAPSRLYANVQIPDAPATPPAADVQRLNAPVRLEADVQILDVPSRLVLMSRYLILLPDQRLMSRNPMLLSDRRLMYRDMILLPDHAVLVSPDTLLNCTSGFISPFVISHSSSKSDSNQ